MSVKFFKEDIDYQLKEKTRLKNWIKDTIQNEKHQLGAINYIFTSDKYLLSINKEYLSHDYFTDIVTFNYVQGKIISGDIFIGIQTVKNNATRFNVTYIEEVHRVMIHGVLHLIGYDDQNDKEKALMREKENYYLERLKNLF